MKKGLFPVAIITIILLLTAGCTNSLLPLTDADYPSIEHRNIDPEFVRVDDSFSFQDSEVSVSFYVDQILYEDAKNTDKYVYLYEDLPEDEWSTGYYRSFVENEYMDEVYESIVQSLRQIRDTMSLDDDEYLELITVYVQSIPYKTDEVLTDPKYPVETVFDNYGDCDDKSILLAGLLSKEGYDVVLLEYADEEHMNIGINSTDCQYMDTGYAAIEATDVNLVGWEKIEVGDDGLVLDSVPLVIGIDGGTGNYSMCYQVQEIYDKYEEVTSKCESLSSKIEKKEAELEVIEADVNKMYDRLNGYMDSRDIVSYNNYVPVYNAKVKEYEDKYEEIQDLITEYNSCVDVHNRILEHQYDRKGLYEYIQTL